MKAFREKNYFQPTKPTRGTCIPGLLFFVHSLSLAQRIPITVVRWGEKGSANSLHEITRSLQEMTIQSSIHPSIHPVYERTKLEQISKTRMTVASPGRILFRMSEIELSFWGVVRVIMNSSLPKRSCREGSSESCAHCQLCRTPMMTNSECLWQPGVILQISFLCFPSWWWCLEALCCRYRAHVNRVPDNAIYMFKVTDLNPSGIGSHHRIGKDDHMVELLTSSYLFRKSASIHPVGG